MAEPAQTKAQALLHDVGLPKAWRQQHVWRILDTRFDTLRFLSVWLAWQADAQRPRLLHYVALTDQPPDARALLQSAAPDPELSPLAQELAAHCFGLLPGFHRVSLQQGQVLLTLCVGAAHAMLRELQFAADTIFLAPSDAWDGWALKSLARCSRRGTVLTVRSAATELQQGLAQCGFDMRATRGEFNPRWELKTTREPLRTHAATPTTCAVIGAGLAGTSVAAALARRGWQVQVLDAAPTPAAGASGLPAGLVVPHVSVDDSPRSRLSRAGVRLTLQQAHSLLKAGADWDASGVLEHRVDGSPGLPHEWPKAGEDWSRATTDRIHGSPWGQGMRANIPTLWHAQAAWIKPARLVQAWLAQPGVRFVGNAAVAALRKDADEWLLLDAAGQTLARARHVVLANAYGALQLLNDLKNGIPELRAGLACLPALRGVRGVVSCGLRSAGDATGMPPFPVNGLGSLIPAVPVNDGLAWYAGATYDAVDQTAAPDKTHHQTNFEKLRKLLPAAAQALGPVFTAGRVQAWTGTRCVSADRLPLAGALQSGDAPSLWISTAMGSRGLSFSVLCAELLAARMGAEPLPIEASLARSLLPRRAAGHA